MRRELRQLEGSLLSNVALERSKQRLSVASFSRQQELDADEAGVKVIARAGYDPYGASRFLSALGRSSDLRAALYG